MTIAEFREAVYGDYARTGQMIEWAELPVEDLLALMDECRTLTTRDWVWVSDEPELQYFVGFKLMGIDLRPLPE